MQPERHRTRLEMQASLLSSDIEDSIHRFLRGLGGIQGFHFITRPRVGGDIDILSILELGPNNRHRGSNRPTR
jgi:hypothetical protein